MERLTPQHSQLQGLDKIMGFSHPLHCPLCPCRVLTHYHNQQPVSPWLSSVSWINDVTVTQGVELSYKCNNKWYFPSTSLAASRVNSGAIPKLSNTCPLWWYQHFVLHHHWHCQVSNLWPIIMERLTPQHSQLQGLDNNGVLSPITLSTVSL